MHKLYLGRDNPKIEESKCFSINTRKYLGNKTNFIPLINIVIKENKIKFKSVMEACMGTGVLSYYFASNEKQVIANDLLPLNFILGSAFMRPLKRKSLQKIFKIMYQINNLTEAISGTITKKYKNKYIPSGLSKKLDAAVSLIKKAKNLSSGEKYYLAASLILAIEKSSNIDSDYLGLEKIKNKISYKLKPLKTLKNNNAGVYNLDAIQLVKKYRADLTIIDPPFSASDYSDYLNYPEFIVEKIFPHLRRPGHSIFCDKTKASEAFRKFIYNVKSPYLIFFYSWDGLIKLEKLSSFIQQKFRTVKIYKIIRKKGLHLVRREPKTDYLILGVK